MSIFPVVVWMLSWLFAVSGAASVLDFETLTHGADGLRISRRSSVFNGIYSIKSIGDFNGDGVNDFVLGFPAMSSAGAVFMVLGGQSSEFDPVSFSSGPHGMKIAGATAGDQFGHSVASVGDVNGDGYDDCIIGAPEAGSLFRPKSGMAYVIFGRPGPYSDMQVDSSMSSDVGFRIIGDSSFALLGSEPYSLDGALGDINGDGIADFAIGSPDSHFVLRNSAGAVFVLYGRRSSAGIEDIDLANDLTGRGLRIGGAAQDDHVGLAISGAGDVNGDGIRDLLIGCAGCDPQGRKDAGAVYLIYGSRDMADLDLAQFQHGSQGARFVGATPSHLLGTAVSNAADLNGDGLADMVLGAPGADDASNVGCVHVVYGSQTAQAHIDLSNLEAGHQGYSVCDAAPGFRIGTAVSYAGDVNEDGVDDVLLGAGSGMEGDERDVYVLYGDVDVPESDIRLTAEAESCLVVPAASQHGSTQLMSVDSDTWQSAHTDPAPLLAGAVRVKQGRPYTLQCGDTTPTQSPSRSPTQGPTIAPSRYPTINPTQEPTLVPTLSPTVEPTPEPSAAGETLQPTSQFAPTDAPTTAPSLPVEEYEVSAVVEQVINCSPDVQLNHRDELEKTIQHAVAASLNLGVTPELVSSISLRAESAQAHFIRAQFVRRSASQFHAAPLDAQDSGDETSMLQYTATTRDPAVTFDMLRARIVEMSNSGELTDSIRRYAQEFGLEPLTAASVGPAAVENEGPEQPTSHSSNDNLSNGEIAGIVVGVVLFVLLAAALVVYCCGWCGRKGGDGSGKDLMPQASAV